MSRRTLKAVLGGALLMSLVVWLTPEVHRFYYRVDHVPTILREAESTGLSPHLIASVIFVESRFRINARSEVGAIGLMQLMPETAEEVAGKLALEDYRLEQLLDPDVNIALGSAYLKDLHLMFGSERDALAAYNAGPSHVWHWQDTPESRPFLETEAFVEKVSAHRQSLESLYPEWTEPRLRTAAL